jgi:tRNA/rRNA methyltransferase
MLHRDIHLNVVLVGTIYDRNIGSSSRAMANMGAQSLILVRPQCEVTYEAQQAAATGQEALRNRKVYSTWDDFFENEPQGLRVAFSAREGKGRPLRDFSQTLKALSKSLPELQTDSKEKSPLSVFLIFGPEDAGLHLKDLELSHYCCSLPIYGGNPSLNLAQAVLLALFIFRQEWGGTRNLLQSPLRKPLPQTRETIFPEKTLRLWLETMNFDLSKRKVNVFTVLRRMFLHNVPTDKELRIFETVLQQSIRRMKKKEPHAALSIDRPETEQTEALKE